MGVIEFYNKKLEEFKDGPKAVSWNSKASQELRFGVLCEIGSLKGKKILDFGCGLGDLCEFLKSYEILGYVGYDINFNMIKAAKKKYPKAVFTSEIGKVFGEYDYILASGVFNLENADWEEDTYRIIKVLFDICKKGLGINFLSSLAENKDLICHYVDPVRMLEFVRSLTPRFVLRHDYKVNDFTVYFYK